MPTIELIKKLRLETMASLIVCKEALIAANDDYEKAKTIISNLKRVETTSERVASKGLCHAVIENNTCILYEVNAETDFISKNEDFVSLIELIGNKTIFHDVNNVKAALSLTVDGFTIEKHIEQTKNKLSEQINLRKYYRIQKENDDFFGLYNHIGKTVCLLIMRGGNQNLANQMAKQIVAYQIDYLDVDLITKETLAYEEMLYLKTNQAADAFKDFIKTKSLMQSKFYGNPNLTVKEVLQTHDATIIDFLKLVLGSDITGKLNCVLDLSNIESKIIVTPVIYKQKKD